MRSVVKPSLAEFKKFARQGNLVPVFIDVLADRVTPVSLMSARWKSSPHALLLESVEGGESLGRYSIVSFEPQAILEQRGDRSVFKTPNGKPFLDFEAPALESLKRYMRCVKAVSVPGLPRFFGGAVGYFSYEIVHGLERVPRTNPDTLKWPEATFFITGDLFVFDNTQQLLKIITSVRIDPKKSLETQYRAAVKRLAAQRTFVQKESSRARDEGARAGGARREEFRSNVDRRQFMTAVKKAKEHIGKGDIIQVVLSRRQEKRTTVSPLDIYRCLRVVNPSPYMYLLKMEGRAIIGSSPEALVRLEDGIATTRPIAGTRRRGKSPEEDDALSAELLKDPKELAEHMMLVDLGRNDLGRVCDFGSVTVPTFKVVERYSHVMHIVSEVRGKVKAGQDAFDLLKAVFPAGTVAGAPKIRAMEIINDLETAQRGPYAGALGYVSYSGNMDMAITIRTLLWDDGKISMQTGAGIVADSNPATEFQETENKAAAMKETVRLAESGELF